MVSWQRTKPAFRKAWALSPVPHKVDVVANVSTGEAEPEDRKFEVILGYAGTLRPTWAT